MKGLRLICPAVRRIEVEEFELGPVPAAGILVENACTGVSVGTEIYNWVHGGEPGQPGRAFPCQTGYCNCGTVLAVGPAVTRVKAGDRVVGMGRHASHAILREGDTPKDAFQKLAPGVAPREAVFLPMAAIGMHALRVSAVQLGEAAVVVGLGLVGQLMATLAGLAGAIPVIGVDIDPFRLRQAEARGIGPCLDPGTVADLAAAIRELTYDRGANVVFEASGRSAVYRQALAWACTGGRVVAVGSPREPVELDLFTDLHLREVTLQGAMNPLTPVRDHVYYRWTMARELAVLMRLLAAGRLRMAELITHEVPPARCQELYTTLASGAAGVLGAQFMWQEAHP